MGRRSEDLATGGCVGVAKATIPRIWDGPRNLSAELEEMRREIAGSPDLQSAREDYAECAGQAGPADRAPAVVASHEECSSIWAAGYEQAATAAADQFVERQVESLAAAAARYEGVMDQIAADQELADHLANTI